MISLIYNETRKLLTRKKTLVVVIALILLTGFMMFAAYKKDQMMKMYNSPEYRIKNMEQSLEYLNRDKDDPKIPEADRKMIMEEIERTERAITELKANPAGAEVDWKREINDRIRNYEEMLKQPGLPESQKDSFKLEIDQYKYLLEHDIRYDEQDLNSFNFLKMLFEILGAVFLAVGVIMFTGDMVSGEYTPATMKFLITQPVSRAKVLFSKFISVVLTSLILILVVEIIAYVLMGLIFGFGNNNYPMFVGTRYEFDMTRVVDQGHPLSVVAGSTYVITRGAFLIKAFLLQILFIIAAASFAFMLSTVLKSSMISISVSIVGVIVFTIFQAMPYVSRSTPYLFTAYGDPFTMMMGGMPLRFQNPIFTMGFGIGVMAVWSIISYVISHFVFTRRDLLI